MQKTYERPAISTIGSLQDLTLAKCNGSGDGTFPQLKPDPNSPSCP